MPLSRRDFLKFSSAFAAFFAVPKKFEETPATAQKDDFVANSWVAPQKAYSEGLRLTAPVSGTYLITATVGGAAGMRLLHNDMHAGPDAPWGVEKYQTVRNLEKDDVIKVQAYHNGPDPKILDARLHAGRL